MPDYSYSPDLSERVRAVGPGDFIDRDFSTLAWFYREGKRCKHPDCNKLIRDDSITCKQHKWWWIKVIQSARILYDVLKGKYEQGEDVGEELLEIGWFLIKVAVEKRR